MKLFWQKYIELLQSEFNNNSNNKFYLLHSFRDGVDLGLSESEKLILESQYEIRYGQPGRALNLVTRGLVAISDLDPITFKSQSGLINSYGIFLNIVICRIKSRSNGKIGISY